jgi:general L-amino acid transport system permease protein
MTTRSIPARGRPGLAGVAAWLRANLFASWASSLGTLAIVALALYTLPGLIEWAVVHAVFRPDAEACRANANAGACWGVVAEKFRAVLFGRYPYEQQWRPFAATLVLIAIFVASCRCQKLGLNPIVIWPVAWLAALIAFVVLMGGGAFGLAPVPTSRWGGLPLTLLLAVACIAGAFPLGVLLALGRRSTLPAIRSLCSVYVELIRGIPLVSILFLASFLFPLFLPPGTSIDVLLRVLGGLILFNAAYLAEIVRGGLQAIPKGQYEAAAALGLGYWQTQRHVVLPQALRAALPALMNNFISVLKETSLVTIVSLYELTGALSLALSGDPAWRPFYLEGYLFIGLIYWGLCFSLSRYSRRLEVRLRPDGTRAAA